MKPTRNDFDEFYEICAAIRDARWGRDGDGDPTVEIRITDRSIGRHPWVPLVPYHHYPESITDEHWLAACSLLDVAGSLAQEARNLIDSHRMNKTPTPRERTMEAALRRIARINQGPDQASAEYRIGEAAAIAEAALLPGE